MFGFFKNKKRTETETRRLMVDIIHSYRSKKDSNVAWDPLRHQSEFECELKWFGRPDLAKDEDLRKSWDKMTDYLQSFHIPGPLFFDGYGYRITGNVIDFCAKYNRYPMDKNYLPFEVRFNGWECRFPMYIYQNDRLMAIWDKIILGKLIPNYKLLDVCINQPYMRDDILCQIDWHKKLMDLVMDPTNPVTVGEKLLVNVHSMYMSNRTGNYMRNNEAVDYLRTIPCVQKSVDLLLSKEFMIETFNFLRRASYEIVAGYPSMFQSTDEREFDYVKDYRVEEIQYNFEHNTCKRSRDQDV